MMSNLFVDFCPPQKEIDFVLISKKINCVLLRILLTLSSILIVKVWLKNILLTEKETLKTAACGFCN